MSVSSGASCQSSAAGPWTRGAASDAAPASAGRGVRLRDQVEDLLGVAAVPLTAAEATPSSRSTKDTTVTSLRRITPLVVRVLLAQRRLALVEASRTTRQSSAVEAARASSTRCCGTHCGLAVLRGVVIASSPGPQWADSSLVLRIRTSRNSAAGHPWETGATWPGWALPQLTAPPSSQVCGPPTASIDPQKSVVVAW